MPPAKSRPSSATGQPLNNRTIANMSRRRANAIASAARATSASPTDGSSLSLSGSSLVAAGAENGAAAGGMFLCQWGQCNRRFHVLGEYAEHVNGEHCRPVNRSGKQCEWAGCWRQDRFTSANQLMCHVRAHTGEKPFKCTLCDLRFSVRSNYNAHVKARHNRPNLDPEIIDFDPATEPHPSSSAQSAPSASVPTIRHTLSSASPEKKRVREPTASPVRKRPTSAADALMVARGAAVVGKPGTKAKGRSRGVSMNLDQELTTSHEDDSDVEANHHGSAADQASEKEDEAPLARKARRNVVSYEETSEEDEDEEPALVGAQDSDTGSDEDLEGECTSLSGRPRIGFQTSPKDDQEYVMSSTAHKRGRRASELSQPSRLFASGRGTVKRLGKCSGPPSRLDLSSAHKLTALRMGQADLAVDALVPGAPPTPPPSATFNLAKRSPARTSSRPRRDSLVSNSTRRDSLTATSGPTRCDSLTALSDRRNSLLSSTTRRNSILVSTKKTTPLKCVHREVEVPEMRTLRQYKTIVAELEHRLRYLHIIENELVDTRARLGLSDSDPIMDAQVSALRAQIQSTKELLQEKVLPAMLAARKGGSASSPSTTIGPDGRATPDNPILTPPSVQKIVHCDANTIGTPASSLSPIHPLYTTPPMTPSLGASSDSSAVAH